jgi:peptidyl-prolyl cis-trans isomerase B (cyclophilin B)
MSKQIASKLSLCFLASLCLTVLNGQELFADEDPVVRLDTSRGPIFIRVLRSVVPYTAGNFLDIVSRGFYSGKTFHRIENWCIQGGDPNGNGSGAFIDPNTGQPRYIRLECNRNLRHSAAGVVAMARGPGENSASCQFYILKCPMFQLDGKYAVFGRVVGGMNAVNAMRRGDVIQSATILAGGPSPQGGASPNQNGGATKSRPRNEPLVPYVPPESIPDSGF